MAVRLDRSNTLILVSAKTGGTWLRQALAAAGVPWREEGPAEAGGQEGLEAHRGETGLTATFVRNPVDWYRSYWAYRMEKGWRERFHLDRTCRDEDFTGFVRKVVTSFPGFLTAMFERYAGPPEDPVGFIGRQEHLGEDLARLLRESGEPFDERALHGTPRANATSLKPVFGEDIVDAISVAEQDMMVRYGYRWADPLGLGEAQRRFESEALTLRRLVLWTERTHWLADDSKRAAARDDVESLRAARCRSNFALFAQFVADDPDYARDCFEAALRLAPGHPRTLANYAAFSADRLGDDEGAERLFRRALESRPGHPHSLTLFARFLAARGRAAEADECRRRLELLSPEVGGPAGSPLLSSGDAQ